MKYDLEYGQDSLEMHADAILKGQRVLIVDDLLATGGTMNACCDLVEKLGGQIVGAAALIELAGLKGREKLAASVCTRSSSMRNDEGPNVSRLRRQVHADHGEVPTRYLGELGHRLPITNHAPTIPTFPWPSRLRHVTIGGVTRGTSVGSHVSTRSRYGRAELRDQVGQPRRHRRPAGRRAIIEYHEQVTQAIERQQLEIERGSRCWSTITSPASARSITRIQRLKLRTGSGDRLHEAVTAAMAQPASPAAEGGARRASRKSSPVSLLLHGWFTSRKAPRTAPGDPGSPEPSLRGTPSWSSSARPGPAFMAPATASTARRSAPPSLEMRRATSTAASSRWTAVKARASLRGTAPAIGPVGVSFGDHVEAGKEGKRPTATIARACWSWTTTTSPCSARTRGTAAVADDVVLAAARRRGPRSAREGRRLRRHPVRRHDAAGGRPNGVRGVEGACAGGRRARLVFCSGGALRSLRGRRSSWRESRMHSCSEPMIRKVPSKPPSSTPRSGADIRRAADVAVTGRSTPMSCS